MSVPIQNIYYLLCYAWDHWDEGQIVDVSSVDSPELADLFAKVLIEGTNRVLRQGLDRGYLVESEDTPRLRGRIDFAISLKRQLFPRAQAHCHFDELSPDVLHNQILATTITRLSGVRSLDSSLRGELVRLRRHLVGVREIRLSRQAFRRVQLHSNNAFYRFLIDVCELVHNQILPNEQAGSYGFREYIGAEGDRWKLFETFVANFYRREQRVFDVSSQSNLYWDVRWASPGALDLLPRMQPDVMLRSPDRVIILDTKFYRDALQRSNYRPKFHSSHLYQLFAYLKNAGHRDGGLAKADGILLYPTVGFSLNETLQLEEHVVRLVTVDLGQPWKSIHDALLDVVNLEYAHDDASHTILSR